MNILSMSKNDKVAVIQLSTSELVAICNALYKAPENQRNDLYYKLYSGMMIASDITQYGNIDAFCLEKVRECRSNIRVIDDLEEILDLYR